MSQQKLPLVEAIKVVLNAAGQPLQVREIVQQVLKAGLWSTTGKTPLDTVSARLATDIKANGSTSVFIRTAPNIYGLNPAISSLGIDSGVTLSKNTGQTTNATHAAATPASLDAFVHGCC
jgi:hypothetical protein